MVVGSEFAEAAKGILEPLYRREHPYRRMSGRGMTVPRIVTSPVEPRWSSRPPSQQRPSDAQAISSLWRHRNRRPDSSRPDQTDLLSRGRHRPRRQSMKRLRTAGRGRRMPPHGGCQTRPDDPDRDLVIAASPSGRPTSRDGQVGAARGPRSSYITVRSRSSPRPPAARPDFPRRRPVPAWPRLRGGCLRRRRRTPNRCCQA
jgi:hypothetical protein